MIIGEGPVQAVSVGHVGLAVTFDYQDGSYGLGFGTHTGMPSASTHADPSLVTIGIRCIFLTRLGVQGSCNAKQGHRMRPSAFENALKFCHFCP